MTNIHETGHAVMAPRVTPRQRPERVTAIVVALMAIGFSTWVLLTLPIQAAAILTVASVVAWVAWMKTTVS